MSSLTQWLSKLLPALDHRVWILAAGRLLSQVGIGFTLFYAPIFFTAQVGLSATQVGLGIGLGSVAGMAGRFLGGSLVDSPTAGRRPTLLASALVSAVADGALILANTFPIFVLGNLLMGFGVGLYWPAAESVAADITTPQQRNEAYALVRLADNIGLGVGVVAGGALISLTGAYRALFAIDGITFLLFFGIIYSAIAETRPADNPDRSLLQGWGHALRDTNLMVYALVNVMFTGYLAQIQSTLPLYLSRFGGGGEAVSEGTLSLLFTGHVVLAAIAQLPVARWLNRYSRAQGLMVSALLWGLGFGLVWRSGTGSFPLAWGGLALGVMALAMVAYTPIGSALVAAIAPEALRGVYLSVNSMCWAVGYLIGPPLGGWAIDQGAAVAHGFWLGLVATVAPALAILVWLDRRLRRRGF
ncbi:MFS transporter [Nodosilinea sp. LEGE 06152]|uniref:MFS transporter n=1 Tax=Nodosilinea sp. LEGE 06152 TaxID=2777966 RepID=UPI00187FB290|nr:MFS transporter [Nodosilinea sp. LEGE 06152]MBE9156169.1 MFS transporter [Nodosilinea sp. LEGE 06152]